MNEEKIFYRVGLVNFKSIIVFYLVNGDIEFSDY